MRLRGAFLLLVLVILVAPVASADPADICDPRPQVCLDQLEAIAISTVSPPIFSVLGATTNASDNATSLVALAWEQNVDPIAYVRAGDFPDGPPCYYEFVSDGQTYHDNCTRFGTSGHLYQAPVNWNIEARSYGGRITRANSSDDAGCLCGPSRSEMVPAMVFSVEDGDSVVRVHGYSYGDGGVVTPGPNFYDYEFAFEGQTIAAGSLDTAPLYHQVPNCSGLTLC